ncbi:PEGA domain-containing protein, partial [bacterium]|nr:PEGA domain-containing protein [bacterium]
EFYPWLCAFLMLSIYLAWRTVYLGTSPIWASAAMALAGGFHSSGVFYFPALLLLPALRNQGAMKRSDWGFAAAFFALYIATAMLHRQPYYFIPTVFLLVPLYFYAVPQAWQKKLRPWQAVYLPWLFLYFLRASLWLKSEPLLEHIPPLHGPYDPGVFFYTFFSWGHLFDISLFHLWMAPFGMPVLILSLLLAFKRINRDPWMTYLLHLCLWTLIWSWLFYPQLRSRDWDLFASISIPMNVYALFALWKYASRREFYAIASIAIALHLWISVPVVVRNSSLLEYRGYVTVSFETKPVQSRVFLRGLELGNTPITQENIRAGYAEIRMIPLERGHGSWSQDVLLEDGKSYTFSETLPEVETPPIPEAP